MKNIIKKVIGRLGYHLETNKPVQLFGDDPREVPYLKNLPFSVIDLPVERGVGLRFYSLTGNTCHPFVYSLLKSWNDKDPEKTIYNILKTYSELVTYNSPNDYLGYDDKEVFPIENHPYEFTYPWSVVLPAARKSLYLSINRQENLRCGFDSKEYLENKSVSEKKIGVESKRLTTLLRSIEKNGYIPQYHDALNCFVLVRGEEWKWYVESGQHRVAVLAVLGNDRIPAHVRQVIRREDVLFWPAVQSGFFSENAALDLFDRMFDLEPPAIARAWVDHVKNNPV